MPIDLLSLLLSAGVRACVLALIAFAGLFLFRVRSSAARHATWTVVVLGMLLQIALGTAVPGVRLKVLPAVAAPARGATRAPSPGTLPLRTLSSTVRRISHPRRGISWAALLSAMYIAVSMWLFARIALGLWGLRRVLRDAKPVPELGPCFLESVALAVPASVGWFRPRILLPPGWRGWDAITLRAVIAHEFAHTRRRDWLVCLVSQINVCIFWFHPLAWWVNHELACLAEEAADDIALCEMEDRDQYAATLLEFARAAAAGGALLHWGAVSMAKESNVGRRVNRIMNWRRRAARPFGRMAWVMLLTCSMPLIYLSAAVELAPGNRPLGSSEHAAVHGQRLETATSPLHREKPRTLIAQALPSQTPPNQPLQSAPPVIQSAPDNHPLSLCILIDNSGSMRGRQNEAKAAALALVEASKAGDEVCIVDFNDEVYIDSDLNTDLDRARNALRRVDSRGGSSLRDAIKLSVDHVERKAHNRKVLVVITDGDDNSSAITEAQLDDRIRNGGVLVYSIALLDEQDMRNARAKQALMQLGTLTGGGYYHVEAPAEVESIASEIERDARNK